MMKLLILFVVGFFTNISTAFSQETSIDTIPFSMENKILVFKASINDIAIDFAFDTGAAIGLSNSSVLSKSDIVVKKGSQTITDANLKKVKINNTVIKKMKIGQNEITNVKGVFYDMEFLTCQAMYLLGMDVIGQLNWKIDFTRKLIYVSKTPFLIDENAQEIPVSNSRHRPKTSLTINGVNYSNCLIDLGYTGILEIPENKQMNLLYQQLQGTGKTSIGLTSNMSVTGLGKADTVKTILLDTVKIGSFNFPNVSCAVFEKTGFKIGIGFFSSQALDLVLNNTNEKFYLVQNPQPKPSLQPLDARVTYQNGKLIITSLNFNKNSSAKNLSIGEIVKTIDGKKASDFKDNCEFLIEYYHTKNASILVEKEDGSIVTIKRSMLN